MPEMSPPSDSVRPPTSTDWANDANGFALDNQLVSVSRPKNRLSSSMPPASAPTRSSAPGFASEAL